MAIDILITGGNGMLGRTLRNYMGSHSYISATRNTFDITDCQKTTDFIKLIQPKIVIHCAAMTNVDLCESEHRLAFKINEFGTCYIAKACEEIGARLIYISTDYVFAGDLKRPYTEKDYTAATSIYGMSKAAGERAVKSYCSNYCIARTGWLYGPTGKSFVRTISELTMSKDAPETLKVVSDQVGSPTSTDSLCEGLVPFLDNNFIGIVHLTCEGEATWFDLAVEVGKYTMTKTQILPCATGEFPRPAPRPRNSRLEKVVLKELGLPPMKDWKEALSEFMIKNLDYADFLVD